MHCVFRSPAGSRRTPCLMVMNRNDVVELFARQHWVVAFRGRQLCPRVASGVFGLGAGPGAAAGNHRAGSTEACSASPARRSTSRATGAGRLAACSAGPGAYLAARRPGACTGCAACRPSRSRSPSPRCVAPPAPTPHRLGADELDRRGGATCRYATTASASPARCGCSSGSLDASTSTASSGRPRGLSGTRTFVTPPDDAAAYLAGRSASRARPASSGWSSGSRRPRSAPDRPRAACAGSSP